ncbi:hypothetical protein AK88_01039 [Plasmodium fragile]|uniref:Sin3 associated polypeptide p18-like protein n=1 Tax=Plasmodium fragile TaxID=5857 RepID=A0A0D9QR09_PLAFR|nr:uncharacterized protein AK88_01039 [Plasmodium fragile]KJP89373.1 hypothetical protein AK88_01039 [Plasmodium fragile]
MSSSEESSFLQNDKGNNSDNEEGKENLVEKGGGSDEGSEVKLRSRSDVTNETDNLVKEDVEPSEGTSEHDKASAKGKPRKEYKRRTKEDASEKSYASCMSLHSLSDVANAEDVKRKSEKKMDKKSSSHRVKRHKGEKRRRRGSSSHGRSGSRRRSDIRRGRASSGESRYGRERKERKRKKEVKKKRKHKMGDGAGDGGGRYSKLSSFSLSSSYTDDDIDLESMSDFNYKRQKKIQKKATSDYPSSKNHHHRYGEEKGDRKKRHDETKRGSSNLVSKKKNGSTRGLSKDPSYSISLSSEGESTKRKKKKKKKKLAGERSGRRTKRGSTEEHNYKHNSRVHNGDDNKFNNAKYHYWRDNSGESPSEEHRMYDHDDGRSSLCKKHSQKGTTKGHTNIFEGDQKRGSEKRRMEKKKKSKIRKENKAYKASLHGRRSDADEYESTTDSTSNEVQSRSSHVPTRKKRKAYLSDAESTDLAVSLSSDDRSRARGRGSYHDTAVMVRSKRERTGGRVAAEGLHHNRYEDDDTYYFHSRLKRGDPFREGRPRMTDEEGVPIFRDREWQPYGGTHHREFEKKRKMYLERGDGIGHATYHHDTYDHVTYNHMARPNQQRNYDHSEYKKDVAVLIKTRRQEYYPQHGKHRFEQVSIPNGMINRDKTCPFLLRLFYKLDDEYNDVEDVNICKQSGVQSNELQIYGWLDITMREIVTLVKDFYQESRKRDAHWVFKVYSNENKKLTFLSRVHSTKYNYREDNKTLLSLDYEIGDILLLSIMFERQAT